ncbi:glucosyltransferase domain-containing protein [Francisella hispaniensis]|uniref:Hypothetical membrane protein n=1 Tax=Francisella hispaniensis TaxID=622488 RepID=F4BHH6_9GAMM|nr:glucosyltransferase domain-containing protein [Francisella hispaniensis]AEE26920.1 hypothetical membrane protein [Francisella hispaniensis]
MKKLITDLRNLPNKLIYSIIVLFSLFIVIYAYFILSWSIGMDTELATYGLGNSEYLYPLHTQYFLLDRPILAIITYALGQVAIPYFTLLISMSLLFVSAIIWIVILTKKNFSIIETLVFCSFYLISPIYIFQFNFVNQAIGIGIGFVLASLAIYHFSLILNHDCEKFKSYIACIVYLFLSIGIYQSFIILFAEGVIFLLILEQLKNIRFCLKDIIYILTKISFVSFAALIGYLLISKLIYIFIGESHYLANVYEGWHSNSFLEVIKHLLVYFANILISPLSFTYVLAWLLLICFIRKFSLIIILALLGCLALPFAFAIFLGAPIPLRILFPIPLSIAIVMLLIFRATSKKKLLIAIVCLCLFVNFKQICQLTYSQNMVQKYNEYNLEYIYSILHDKFGNNLYHTPVVFIASPKADDSFYIKHIYSEPFYFNSDEDFLSNIFPDKMWQTSSINHRVYYFMQWLGLFYKLPTKQQIELGRQISPSLSIFPEKGSITKKDNIIFVKLSE